MTVSAATSFRNDGETFSTSNNTLVLLSTQTTNGQDSIGQFVKTTLSWQSASGVAFQTAIRTVWGSCRHRVRLCLFTVEFYMISLWFGRVFSLKL